MTDKNNTSAIAATHSRMERRMWSTEQTHRKNELYTKLQQLNKQIKELSQEWRN